MYVNFVQIWPISNCGSNEIIVLHLTIFLLLLCKFLFQCHQYIWTKNIEHWTKIVILQCFVSKLERILCFVYFTCFYSFWYILNELDTLACHYEVYILKCQTCATVVIVVGYANKPYRLGDSLKEALHFLLKYLKLSYICVT